MMPRNPLPLLAIGLLAALPAAATQDAPESPPPPVAAEPAPPAAPTDGEDERRRLGWLRTLGRDSARFYAPRRLGTLAAGFAVGGLMANTDVDQNLYDDYWQGAAAAEAGWVDGADRLGDAGTMLPLVLVPAIALGLGERDTEHPVAGWWRRSARAYLVGGPAFYYLQQMSGGSRPGEVDGSSWKPFEGNHGISGHAFLGAVPFLTAARMADSRWAKVGLAVLSLAPAAARLEQEQHYPSQALLGWYLAWEATGAVADSSAEARREWQVVPLAARGGGGAAFSLSLP